MATPTDYEPAPSYNPQGFCFSSCKPGCEEPLFYSSPMVFCEDVTMQKDLYVLSDLYVSNLIITGGISVGGAKFAPTTIEATNGTFTVMAQV